MTFHSDEYKLWYKDFPMFVQWAFKNGVLFIPKISEDNEYSQYDLESKVYLLMSRLHQNYETIMRMDSSVRDGFFVMEMERLKQEKEDSKKK